LSFFFFSASIVATYNFTTTTCTTIIISLEPCALNARFQHFIPKFNNFFLFGYYWKRGLKVKGGPKIGWLYKKFSTYTDFESVFDKDLHWLCVSVKNIYTHINHVSVNVKSSDINVNDLHLHGIYTVHMAIQSYMNNTRTNLMR
jgi:hypothetical protein